MTVFVLTFRIHYVSFPENKETTIKTADILVGTGIPVEGQI